MWKPTASHLMRLCSMSGPTNQRQQGALPDQTTWMHLWKCCGLRPTNPMPLQGCPGSQLENQPVGTSYQVEVDAAVPLEIHHSTGKFRY